MSVFVDSEKCTGCGICIPICPVQVISIKKNKAVIDDNRCIECLQCIDECPANAIYQISDKEVSVIKRQNSIPDFVSKTSPQAKQTSRSDRQKQPVTETGGTFLSGIKRMANNFFRNEASFGRRGRGRGYGKHRRGRRRGRR